MLVSSHVGVDGAPGGQNDIGTGQGEISVLSRSGLYDQPPIDLLLTFNLDPTSRTYPSRNNTSLSDLCSDQAVFVQHAICTVYPQLWTQSAAYAKLGRRDYRVLAMDLGPSDILVADVGPFAKSLSRDATANYSFCDS